MTTNWILRLSKSQETYDIKIGTGLQMCTVWWASFNHLITMTFLFIIDLFTDPPTLLFGKLKKIKISV